MQFTNSQIEQLWNVVISSESRDTLSFSNSITSICCEWDAPIYDVIITLIDSAIADAEIVRSKCIIELALNFLIEQQHAADSAASLSSSSPVASPSLSAAIAASHSHTHAHTRAMELILERLSQRGGASSPGSNSGGSGGGMSGGAANTTFKEQIVCVRRHLAELYAASQQYDKVCHVLSALLPLDDSLLSGGATYTHAHTHAHAQTDTHHKLDILVQLAKSTMALDQLNEAETHLTRATQYAADLSSSQSNSTAAASTSVSSPASPTSRPITAQQEVLLEYKMTFANLLTKRRKFIEAASKHLDIAVPPSAPPLTVAANATAAAATNGGDDVTQQQQQQQPLQHQRRRDEAGWIEARLRHLELAVHCVVLSAPSPTRARILAALCNDERVKAGQPHRHTHSLLTKLLLRRPLTHADLELISQQLLAHPFFSSSSSSSSCSLSPGRVEGAATTTATKTAGEAQREGEQEGEMQRALRRAFVQHNILALSTIYKCVTLDKLAALLQIPLEQAEEIAAEMICQGQIRGAIDQIEEIIYFESADPLSTWDNQIAHICDSLNKIVETIESRHPDWAQEIAAMPPLQLEPPIQSDATA